MLDENENVIEIDGEAVVGNDSYRQEVQVTLMPIAEKGDDDTDEDSDNGDGGDARHLPRHIFAGKGEMRFISKGRKETQWKCTRLADQEEAGAKRAERGDAVLTDTDDDSNNVDGDARHFPRYILARKGTGKGKHIRLANQEEAGAEENEEGGGVTVRRK